MDGESPETGQRLLNDALRQAMDSCWRGSVQINCEMPRGRAVSALVRLSQGAELLVVGCLGTGTLRGRHLGSVSAGLIHDAPCPVVILHDDVQLNHEAAQKPVVVGIDGSPESEAAIGIAFDEASRRRVGLTAIHTWKPVSIFDDIVSFPGPGWPALRAVEDEILSERLAGWSERYPDVRVQRIVARDDPIPQLVHASQSAQLMVVGGCGSGGFAGMLFGSVSAGVVLLAHVPVMVARSAGTRARQR